MRYNILQIETKGAGWKLATIQDLNTQDITERVSINKVGKKGEVFPNFDALKLNDSIEGSLWVSQKGAAYLFPSKPEKPQGGAFKRTTGDISKAVEVAQGRKNDFIENVQENKNLAIKVSSTLSKAVDLAIAEYGTQTEPVRTLDELFIKWRLFLFNHWDDPEQPNFGVPFN